MNSQKETQDICQENLSILAGEHESPTNELRKTRKEGEEYSQFFPSLKRSLASVQPSKVVGRIHRDHVDMKLINGESTISHRKSLASAVMYEILVVDLHHDA
jgi:hypothetical protein